MLVMCHFRLFGTKCDKCLRSFGKNDFVMRAKNKIFHLECFRCVACEKQLVPGDEFALRDDGLFCREDHQESDHHPHHNLHHHHHRKDSIENNNTILHHNTSNSSEDNSEGNDDKATFWDPSAQLYTVSSKNDRNSAIRVCECAKVVV